MTNLKHLESVGCALNKRSMVNLARVVQDAHEEIIALRKIRQAAHETLKDCADLADGDDCTLIKLKRALAQE